MPRHPFKDCEIEQPPAGMILIRGAAFAGEEGIKQVDMSDDDGQTWHPATLIGLSILYAWCHWEYLCEAKKNGIANILSRAISTGGTEQPDTATWNVLGHCNNGVREHGKTIQIG